MYKFVIGPNKFIVEFSAPYNHNYYDNKYSSGLIISDNKYTYDITYNREVDWYRIFINGNDGYMKDLPFNESTWQLLPEGVKVYEYK